MKAHYTLAPLFMALLLLAAWVAVLAIPGAFILTIFFLALVTTVGVLVVALILAITLVTLFWRRHWISGLTMCLGLLGVLLLATRPSVATSPALWVADVTHVLYYRGALLEQSRELRSKGVSPAVAAIAIDGFGSMTSGIAFDPTGEIVLPPNKRSQAWMAAAGRTELGVDDLQARQVVGNYYSWFHD
jgi:hypothetical protein